MSLVLVTASENKKGTKKKKKGRKMWSLSSSFILCNDAHFPCSLFFFFFPASTSPTRPNLAGEDSDPARPGHTLDAHHRGSWTRRAGSRFDLDVA